MAKLNIKLPKLNIKLPKLKVPNLGEQFRNALPRLPQREKKSSKKELSRYEKDRRYPTLSVFILYVLASAAAVMGFCYLFPTDAAPLRNQGVSWQLLSGALTMINVFPALILSALILPFGMGNAAGEDGTHDRQRFSARVIEGLRGPIFCTLFAAIVYSLIFFIALPLLQNRRAEMEFQGKLFRLAQERAAAHALAQEWPEADRFISICASIWPDSPETMYLVGDIAAGLEAYTWAEAARRAESLYDIDLSPEEPEEAPSFSPLRALDALNLASTAFSEDRYYDAHALATLAQKLSPPGTVEAGRAAQVAALSWNALAGLEPRATESEGYRNFHLKRDSYAALVAGDWIRSYYGFKELLSRTPRDPDAERFFAQSQREVEGIAFFIDEMEMDMGGGSYLFSLPWNGGRLVMRLPSLSAFSDYAYGIGIEGQAFDRRGTPLFGFSAPYVKILPSVLEGRGKTLLLMRSLSETEAGNRWEPRWTGEDLPGIGRGDLVLDMDYEVFLLQIDAARGAQVMPMEDLYRGQSLLGDYGYIREIFQAEIVNRFVEILGLLPLATLILSLSWRLRAGKRPRMILIPMLFVLPMGCFALWLGYRSFIQALGVWMVLTIGFVPALIVSALAAAASFFLALLVAACQRS
jgi:hypothetical protein